MRQDRRYTNVKLAAVMALSASLLYPLLLVASENSGLRDKHDAGISHRERLEDWLQLQGYGTSLEIRQVNIFGDGDPGNGIEDNRIDMSSPYWNKENRQAWNMGAGTIHCEGRNRGSAIIVDTREFGGINHGLIIATSAHVLFDLQNRRLYESCRFHFMALDHLPGYQGNIRLEWSRIGGFDPSEPRNGKQFGKKDWAFLFVEDPVPGVSLAGSLQLRPYRELIIGDKSTVNFQFIGFSQSSGSIAISTVCDVRESLEDDLGGGAWPGQLLDNCDSEGGASGGGLVASIGGKAFLVGIRSGSHWSGEMYPKGHFPEGPPDGSNWDTRINTNYGRAIDQDLITELRSLVKRIND